VQRRALVRRIDGDPAGLRLDVEHPARPDERADVGDRVADPVPVAAALDVHRLVEVARPRRVDRHERQVDALPGRLLALPRSGRLGLAQRLVGERARHARLAPDRLEPLPHRRGRIDADAAGGHAAAG
jgi:hypothetical protein